MANLELFAHNLETVNFTNGVILTRTASPELELSTCVNNFHCNLRYSLSWTIVLFIAYLIVFIIGLFGNLSVLWIVCLLKRDARHRRPSCVISTGTVYGGNGQSLLNSSCYGGHYSTKTVININRSNLVFYRFVCNLALADLLVVLFCLPPTLIGNIYLREYHRSRQARSHPISFETHIHT